jgi:preprotein translocase subunit YajC
VPFSLQYLPLLAIAAAAYLLLFRPERERVRKQQDILASLKKNDRVVTSSGIYGTVANVEREADRVTLKVDDASNVKITVTLSSVSRVLRDGAGGDGAGPTFACDALVVDGEPRFDGTPLGPGTRETEVAAGREVTVGVVLRRRARAVEGQTELQRPVVPVTPATPSRGVSRNLAWVGFGIGAAGLIGFAAFGAAAGGTFSDLQTRCGNAPCPPSEQGTVNQGRTFTTAANVSLGVGIAGVVGKPGLQSLRGVGSLAGLRV